MFVHCGRKQNGKQMKEWNGIGKQEKGQSSQLTANRNNNHNSSINNRNNNDVNKTKPKERIIKIDVDSFLFYYLFPLCVVLFVFFLAGFRHTGITKRCLWHKIGAS